MGAQVSEPHSHWQVSACCSPTERKLIKTNAINKNWNNYARLNMQQKTRHAFQHQTTGKLILTATHSINHSLGS